MAPKPEMGKFLLYSFFRRDAQVRKYLPTTKRYSSSTLKNMMNRFGMVYVKPVAGSRGKGIMKVWSVAGHTYVQHTVLTAHKFQSLDGAISYIDKLREGKAYIVQQGLRLAQIKSKVFDIRTMVQREVPGGQWRYSGSLAKVAGGRSIVTNTAMSRGSVMETSQALKQSMGWTQSRVDACLADLKQITMDAAKHFDSYQFYRELGFDMAVDENGRIWMIEQNTAPSHVLFAHLKSNLSLHRNIQYRWGHFERAKRKKRKKRAN